MDPDTGASEIAYPTTETLANGQAYINLSQESNQLMDSLWLSVKTAGGVGTGPVICMLAFVALLLGWLTYRTVRDKRRKARRCAAWNNG